ncbi:hypothetical protein [Methylomonas koyamae]|uniref:hypothetical protein n=1 Tax=Methylomonas koyamae TaxID=702114 RepID=UPI000BC34587|nr:hypothetical protein [Methylomonas koyamae]ATG89304.1 hypothetical protein MKLM6_1042 [Methylomonas koyamae]
MSIDNALCPAQQAKAVLDLVMAELAKCDLDDAVVFSLYSVSDNLDRLLQELGDIREADNALFMALSRRGIYDEVMAECAGRKPEPDRLSAAGRLWVPLAAGDAGEVKP